MTSNSPKKDFGSRAVNRHSQYFPRNELLKGPDFYMASCHAPWSAAAVVVLVSGKVANGWGDQK